ncbi:MAG TPA: tripartite tricarboxylate transporter substrate-binding protein [Gemmatimonadaceae bacterium]
MPAYPGGGWDLACRMAAGALGSLREGGDPMQVVNIAGDGGGVAFAKVVETDRGNERVIVVASPSTLLGLAQERYGPRTERDVRWIAATSAEPSVIAVASDAPWHDLHEFVDYWLAHPDSTIIGGGSPIGGQDHMKMLLLARATGLDVRRVRYRTLNGAPEIVPLLQSGTVQVYPGDVSKVQPYVARGELRVLAVLGEHRMTGLLANVPTAREQGYDLAFVIWRGFYAPPGISDSAYEHWVDRLHGMSESPAFAAELERNGLTPFYLGGEDFEKFVMEETANYRRVSRSIGLIQ